MALNADESVAIDNSKDNNNSSIPAAKRSGFMMFRVLGNTNLRITNDDVRYTIYDLRYTICDGVV